MKKIKINQIISGICGYLFSLSCFAQVAVVASAKSEIPTLTRDQVAALYTGNSFTFPNGSSATLLDQSESNEVRKLFYGKVTDKSASQIKSTWSRLTFSGKGTPPKEMANSAEVKKQVATNPNAIGYIEKNAVDGSVKVIFSAD